MTLEKSNTWKYNTILYYNTIKDGGGCGGGGADDNDDDGGSSDCTLRFVVFIAVKIDCGLFNYDSL